MTNSKNYVFELTDPVDTIILGRKMTDGFVSYWSDVMTKPDDPFYAFAKKMIETPKVVFTKTLKKSQWANTDIATPPTYGRNHEAKDSERQGNHRLWWCLT